MANRLTPIPDELQEDLEPHIVSWVKEFFAPKEDEIVQFELRCLVRGKWILDFDHRMSVVCDERLSLGKQE